MIDIDTAIQESKSKDNISDGGSMCFDFGDVVLVRYACTRKYLKEGEHIREKSEEIMEAINHKADHGVNTPRHLSVKRVVEGEDDVCYVLQQKCPGVNCANGWEYRASFEKMCEDLKRVLNIPFEHYKKLISDGFQLFEMGYEAKNKNLFYDPESGFWYIDFLDNDSEHSFDPNDISKVFDALKFRMPKPLQIASQVGFDEQLTPEQEEIMNTLIFGIKAKTLLATRELLPGFQKYEKFLLAQEKDKYKEYLMQEGIVDTDLMSMDESDYKTFHELYEIVMDKLVDKVVNEGKNLWYIQANAIRNESELFNLSRVWLMHNENTIQRKDYEDNYDYEDAVFDQFKERMLLDLINRLQPFKQIDNVEKFLAEASQQLQDESEVQK